MLTIPDAGVTTSTDVPSAWPNGASWHWIGGDGKLANQPATYGSVMTMRKGLDAQQIFISTSGDAWSRSASSVEKTWKPFIKLS